MLPCGTPEITGMQVVSVRNRLSALVYGNLRDLRSEQDIHKRFVPRDR